MGHPRMADLSDRQLCEILMTAHIIHKVLLPRSSGGRLLPAQVMVESVGLTLKILYSPMENDCAYITSSLSIMVISIMVIL